MDIAFLGLGGMGSGMARSLMKHGHKVTVWNRSSEPAEAIHEQGAQVAATPAEVARHAEIAITMLADDKAVESVVFGGSGLAEGLPKDAVHVSMSTISVALSEQLDLAHAERGQQFVAAPVFGRPDQAEIRQALHRRGRFWRCCQADRPSIGCDGTANFCHWRNARAGQPTEADRQFPHHMRHRKPR